MQTKVSEMHHGFPDPENSENIIYNPSFEEMRSFSQHLETTTEYGSASYVSEYRSRSADKTKNTIDHDFSPEDVDHMKRAQDYLEENEMVCVDRKVGRHPDHSYTCRLFVPKEYARIALAYSKLMEPSQEDPDFYTVQIPDWDDTRIRVLPETGVTYVLGSDYTGEAKKSFLRLFMYYSKQEGGLGLHAGTKRVELIDEESDEMKEVGQLYLGLSGTGKSTLTSHGFWLEDPENAEMLQDDVCALFPDGLVGGSEGNGLYIKTIGLEREEQPELYHAATQEDAVLENVDVDDSGKVDFDSDAVTSNSRAVIRREDLSSAPDEIDLPEADQVFFITRNALMPPVAKLSSRQGAVAFMLGESVETSAGDPDKAGESVRVVGTNPFIVGPEGEEGNRFHDLIEGTGIDCFVINTGKVGENPGVDIGVEDTVQLLKEIARGSIEWIYDETLDLTIPEDVPGMEIENFYPPDHFDDYETRLQKFRQDRQQYLEEFDELDEDIKDAVY